jgi:hypothetical protein
VGRVYVGDLAPGAWEDRASTIDLRQLGGRYLDVTSGSGLTGDSKIKIDPW